MVVAIVQGALCGAMFWLLGVPSAALWGLATVICSVLPVFGAAAVWVPGAIYLAVIGEWQRAIIMAVWGAAVVSTIDNFLRPRLVAGRVGLDELPMFFAMLGGLSVFGVLGIVLGPVTFATAAALVQILTDTSDTGNTAESGTHAAAAAQDGWSAAPSVLASRRRIAPD
jgi:predicted PurR-regulated permease PerM